jgi:hypothetical protein
LAFGEGEFLFLCSGRCKPGEFEWAPELIWIMQKTEKSLLLPVIETRFRGPHYSSTYDTDATLTSLTVLEMAPRWEHTAATLISSLGALAFTTCSRIFRLYSVRQVFLVKPGILQSITFALRLDNL